MIQGCMRRIPQATVINLIAEERAELEGLARSTKTEHRLRQWALSSAGERPLHTGEVVGSIPTAPTREIK
jgi:hypothetical protein